MMTLHSAAIAFGSFALLTACGTSNTASHLASAPAPGGSFENKCKPGIVDDKPLVVALASTDKRLASPPTAESCLLFVRRQPRHRRPRTPKLEDP
jgi:hypothetical protein